ncbi:hypothetical protein SUGI_0173210 [Cryptomeria japonica]|nr:hypothetical protein SUGI_0173210 [Cryptomeria japonica]
MSPVILFWWGSFLSPPIFGKVGDCFGALFMTAGKFSDGCGSAMPLIVVDANVYKGISWERSSFGLQNALIDVDTELPTFVTLSSKFAVWVQRIEYEVALNVSIFLLWLATRLLFAKAREGSIMHGEEKKYGKLNIP